MYINVFTVLSFVLLWVNVTESLVLGDVSACLNKSLIPVAKNKRGLPP
ncbi:MAG TPA: hypothetical protein VMW10_08715 [Alphaproteobacteria bacterium]|nr:hypothetical protein [Alphaproteobacteria bacterium]